MVTSFDRTPGGHVSVECQFLTQLTSTLETKCRVCIGSPLCQNLTCVSPAIVDLDGSARIELPKLESGLKYCYTATAIVESIEALEVTGQIRTCMLPEIFVMSNYLLIPIEFVMDQFVCYQLAKVAQQIV